jgi:quinol monooxygenase YgiN
MPVLIRHRAAGMTLQSYDELSPPLVEQIKRAPGFKLHVAFEDANGLCVAEIWDSKEQHDAYFNAVVAPNVPAEITQEVIELHSLHEA